MIDPDDLAAEYDGIDGATSHEQRRAAFLWLLRWATDHSATDDSVLAWDYGSLADEVADDGLVAAAASRGWCPACDGSGLGERDREGDYAKCPACRGRN